MRTISVLRRVTISRGVPSGAKTPYHVTSSNPETVSAMGGVSPIAAERFFFRDYHDLRIRTQLALSGFRSDDQWISGLNQDLTDRGWKGGRDGR